MFGIDRKNGIEVFIGDKFLEEYLGKWLFSKNNVKKSIGKILLDLNVCRLGDSVYLHGYDKEMACFDVIINRDGHILEKEIKISLIVYDRIVIIDGEYEYIYECLRDTKGRINGEYLVGYEYEDENLSYSCHLDNTGVEFFVFKDGYYLELDIDKNVDSSKKIFGIKSLVKNEEYLVNYLMNLSFPVEIDEVYKKICEILEIEDFSEYLEISLFIYNYKDNTYLDNTDTIIVRNGIVEEIKITKNNKTVVYYPDSDSWNYEEDRDGTIISVNYDMDDDYSINYIYGDSLFEDISDKELKDVANSEVDSVKKLVKTMFNKDGRI